MLREWKINIDAAEYEKHIDANLYKPSENKINLHDSDSYWPASIKDTINWFPFLPIMEHIANLMKTNKGLILSFLKLFAMFEFRLIGDKEHLEVIAIGCIYCKK